MKNITNDIDYADLVTVVVPYYNHKNYIVECIHSIVNQSYNNIELIVIDDGSADDGWVIIEKLAEEYGFLFIRKDNQGVCKTLNLGLQLAKGRYFCAVASDDALFKYKIEYQLEFLKKEKVPVCSAAATCGTSFHQAMDTSENKNMKYTSCTYEDLLFLRGNVFAVNLFWNTSILKELGGYNELTKLEDLYILLKYTSIYGYIKMLSCDLAFYRSHDGNTSSNRAFVYEERMRLLKSLNFIENKERVLVVNQALIYFFNRKLLIFAISLPKIIFLGGFGQLIKSLKYNLTLFASRW